MLFFPNPRDVAVRRQGYPRSGPRCQGAVEAWGRATRFERSQLRHWLAKAPPTAHQPVRGCRNPRTGCHQLSVPVSESFSPTPFLPGQGRHEASAASSRSRDTRLGMLQRHEKTSQPQESGNLRSRRLLSVRRRTESSSTGAEKLHHWLAEWDRRLRPGSMPFFGPTRAWLRHALFRRRHEPQNMFQRRIPERRRVCGAGVEPPLEPEDLVAYTFLPSSALRPQVCTVLQQCRVFRLFVSRVAGSLSSLPRRDPGRTNARSHKSRGIPAEPRASEMAGN